MVGFTYILECANGQYYVGSTLDLQRRLQQHNSGVGAKFTKVNLPVKLVYQEEYASIEEAFKREHQLKKWSREKKKALIDGDIDKLRLLSNKRN